MDEFISNRSTKINKTENSIKNFKSDFDESYNIENNKFRCEDIAIQDSNNSKQIAVNENFIFL